MKSRDIEPQTVRARELYGDFWFNSEPVPISALRGQVILVEFWDYSCASSLLTIPYLKEWQRKYAPYDFVVIGVHTPRFPFGKNPELVQKAITRLAITYPVVMDNEGLMASQYGSRSVPTIYLIDKNGFIRYENAGDANCEMTERVIQTLLYDAGVGEELPLIMEPLRESDRIGAVCYRATPDLFAGYLRGSIGNVEGYSPESSVTYADPEIYLDGRFYAQGNWQNGKDSLRLDESDDREGHLILWYQALEVGCVVRQEEGNPIEVTVRQDDRFLTSENKGDDVQLGDNGRSYFVIDEPRSFSVVKNKEFGEHILRLSTADNGFGVYAFTFVSGVIPEVVSRN